MHKAKSKSEIQIATLHEIVLGMIEQGWYWPTPFSGDVNQMFEHNKDVYVFRRNIISPQRYVLDVTMHSESGAQIGCVHVTFIQDPEGDRLLFNASNAAMSFTLIDGVFSEHHDNRISRVIEGLTQIATQTTVSAFGYVCDHLLEEIRDANRTLPETQGTAGDRSLS